MFRELGGRIVEPDEVLARYKDWHDVSSWPVSNRQSAVVQRDMKKQADPLSKEGADRGVQPYLRDHRGD